MRKVHSELPLVMSLMWKNDLKLELLPCLVPHNLVSVKVRKIDFPVLMKKNETKVNSGILTTVMLQRVTVPQ